MSYCIKKTLPERADKGKGLFTTKKLWDHADMGNDIFKILFVRCFLLLFSKFLVFFFSLRSSISISVFLLSFHFPSFLFMLSVVVYFSNVFLSSVSYLWYVSLVFVHFVHNKSVVLTSDIFSVIKVWVS